MKKILFQHIKFNTDWEYKNKETGAYFKCGIIKRKVFYISFGGKVEFIDVQNIDKIITQIIIDGKFKNSAHFRIVDLNRNVKISFFARNHLIKTFNSLYSVWS